MRRSISASILAALLAPAASALAQPPGERPASAWLRDGRVEAREIAPDAAVPLGSMWKLFVFSYLESTHAREPAYACREGAARDEEERYCCAAGESIGRESALAKSCAPYFAPPRLGITPGQWSAHWKSLAAPAWLQDLERLRPQSSVPVAEFLRALDAIPPEAKARARVALLETALEGYGRDAWVHLGTGIRYKTYSWHLADGRAYGGAAGWLADGTPFWFGASGSSRSALSSWSQQLAAMLPAPRVLPALNPGDAASGQRDGSCVDVDFFARYPIRAVWHATQPDRARAGELRGRYRVEFANGQWLSIRSRGDLSLEETDGVPTLTGRFTINDYVARVVDREGGGKPVAAARALAIAARTYFIQNARFEAGCWRIADSSRAQRVSPNPPSAAALDAAWFSDDLTLSGVAVQYHSDAQGTNRLAWKEAVARANEGWNFERILVQAYPRASFATLSGREDCTRLEAAERWLAGAAAAWSAGLRREPGFEAPGETPRVCALRDGHPYSDQQRLRIYVRGWRSLDERVTLAHEYLHLAFRFHPNGADEGYIERLARRVAGS